MLRTVLHLRKLKPGEMNPQAGYHWVVVENSALILALFGKCLDGLDLLV